MRVRVCFFEPLDGHVRIDLRRGKTSMAEQRLNAPQIGAAIEHMRSETVPQFMWTDRNWNRRVP